MAAMECNSLLMMRSVVDTLLELAWFDMVTSTVAASKVGALVGGWAVELRDFLVDGEHHSHFVG